MQRIPPAKLCWTLQYTSSDVIRPGCHIRIMARFNGTYLESTHSQYQLDTISQILDPTHQIVLDSPNYKIRYNSTKTSHQDRIQSYVGILDSPDPPTKLCWTLQNTGSDIIRPGCLIRIGYNHTSESWTLQIYEGITRQRMNSP